MVNLEPRLPKGVNPTMAKTAVPRQPRGNKDGGKFAPGRLSESEVELVEEAVPLSDGSKAFEERSKRASEKAAETVAEHVSAPTVIDEPRMTNAPIKLGGAVEYEDGSWNFPPPPTDDIEKMAAYWSNVLIPDSALQNLENGDCTGRDLFTYDEEHRKWINSGQPLSKRLQRKDPEQYAEIEAELKTRVETLRKVQFGLGLIPRSELRDVARLGAFWEQASELDDESRAEAAATEFVTSSGEVLKPLDVVQKYRLWEISGAFFNRVRYSRPD